MPFQTVPTRIANEPLGPSYLAKLRRNQLYLRSATLLEHLANGEHNAVEVPRVAAIISTTTATPSSSDITGVSNPATGTFALTLAAGRFTTNMRVEVCPLGEDLKPYLASYKVVSATSLEIYNKKLTSTLGVAGNAWAAINDSVHVAIYSDQLLPSAWNNELPEFQRTDALIGAPAAGAPSWTSLVKEQGYVQKALSVGHASGGGHQIRQVARVYGWFAWNGSSYSYSSSGVTSITRTSAGVIEVNFSALSNAAGFVVPDYARSNAGSNTVPFIGTAKASGTTKIIVRLFAWDATNAWWQAADGDFFLAVHG